MKRNVPMYAAVVCACAGWLAACGGGEDAGNGAPVAQTRAETPSQAAINMLEAIEAGDRAAFRNALTGEDWQIEAAESLMTVAQAAKRFEDAVRDAYGDEGVEQLSEGGDMNFMPDDPNWRDNVRDEIDGDRATVYIDADADPMSAVLVGDEWKIDAAAEFAEGGREQAEAMKSMFAAMAGAFDQTREEIEAGGVELDEVEERLGQRMMAAFFGGMGG